MWLSKMPLIFVVMCPLDFAHWSVSNFPNQTHYCARLILLWLKCWMNGGLHSMSESLLKLYLCTEMCMCDCACPACLPVDACVQLCVFASSSRVMNWIKHTQWHTGRKDQMCTCILPKLDWTEGLWLGVTLILTTTSVPLLQCFFSATHLPHAPLWSLAVVSSYFSQCFK